MTVLTFPRTLFWIAKWRIKDWWGKKHWPRTVEEAVGRLQAEVDRNRLNEFKSRAEFVGRAYWVLGMYVRNEFGLWRGNRALLADCGVKDADAASSMILARYWDAVHGAQPSASPNGGPAEPPNDSHAIGGPPSVS
jgi:hypothetical protein